MIAFEIHVNGERLCTAGVPAGVMTAVLAWVGGEGREEEAARSDPERPDLTLDVSGLHAEAQEFGDHVRWWHGSLNPGDLVLIRVVEAELVDPPGSREPAGRGCGVMISPGEVKAIVDSDRSDDAKLAALHLLQTRHPGVFCWELLNELRHHYGGRDERASMVFCNGILERSPDDEYILNILSGWKLGADAAGAAAALESVADQYPDLPHLAAACLRKARLLRGPH